MVQDMSSTAGRGALPKPKGETKGAFEHVQQHRVPDAMHSQGFAAFLPGLQLFTLWAGARVFTSHPPHAARFGAREKAPAAALEEESGLLPQEAIAMEEQVGGSIPLSWGTPRPALLGIMLHAWTHDACLPRHTRPYSCCLPPAATCTACCTPLQAVGKPPRCPMHARTNHAAA
jgi:hypothetical protein